MSEKRLHGSNEAIELNSKKEQILVDDPSYQVVPAGPFRLSSSLVRYAAVLVVPKSQRQSVVSHCSPPFIILLISVLQVVYFILYSYELDTFAPTGRSLYQSPFIWDPFRRYQVWRFLTYAFVHDGFFHLLSNLCIQLALGIPLEMIHKCWRVGLVYLSGILAGSLSSSIWDPKSYLTGASSGVYALMAACLVNYLINYQEMEFGLFRAFVLCFVAVVNASISLYNRYTQDDDDDDGETDFTKISDVGHYMGALAGALVSLFVLRNLVIKRWERYLGLVGLVIYISLTVSSIVFNLTNSSHFLMSRY